MIIVLMFGIIGKGMLFFDVDLVVFIEVISKSVLMYGW